MFWRIILFYVAVTSVMVKSQNIIEAEGPTFLNPSTLECHMRPYTFRVTQSDENGKQCWDTVSVMACWGRCDSNEVSHFKIIIFM